MEALRKYERVGEEQVVEVCRVLNGTMSTQKQQELAIQQQLQPTPQQALAIQQQLQPAPQQPLAIQQQLQYTLQQPLAIQQQPGAPPALQHTTPQFSGCTFNNCSFSVPVPQPKHEEIVENDLSSIDINEFLQF